MYLLNMSSYLSIILIEYLRGTVYPAVQQRGFDERTLRQELLPLGQRKTGGLTDRAVGGIPSRLRSTSCL